jgi:hypothetical protein
MYVIREVLQIPISTISAGTRRRMAIGQSKNRNVHARDATFRIDMLPSESLTQICDRDGIR